MNPEEQERLYAKLKEFANQGEKEEQNLKDLTQIIRNLTERVEGLERALAGTMKSKPKRDRTPLQRWLVDQKMTMKAFAKELGCDPHYLSAVASGKRVPSTRMARHMELLTKGAITARALLGV